MRIVGINGDPSKYGTVSKLLDGALSAARREGEKIGELMTLDTIHLTELHMPQHDGTYQTVPPELEETFEFMRKADGFIFATPTHWYNMSSLMKCFIDWLTSLESEQALYGNVAGIIVHCNDDGGNQTAMSLIAPLLHMGVTIPPDCAFYHNRHVAEKSEDRWQMTHHELVGQNVARMIQLIKDSPYGWNLRT